MKNTRLLKPWNPLDQARWLWWLIVKPECLDTYLHDHAGDPEALNISAWVASLLFWLSFTLTWIVVTLRAGEYRGMLLALVFIALGWAIMAALGTNHAHGQGAQLDQFLLIILIWFYLVVLISGVMIRLADLNSGGKERLVLALGAAAGAAGGTACYADHRSDRAERALYVFSIILIAMGITLGAGFGATGNKGLNIVAANTLFPALFILGFASVLRSSARNWGFVKRAAVLVVLVLAEIAPVSIAVGVF